MAIKPKLAVKKTATKAPVSTPATNAAPDELDRLFNTPNPEDSNLPPFDPKGRSQYNVFFKGHQPKKSTSTYARYELSKADIKHILDNWDTSADWQKGGKMKQVATKGFHPTARDRKEIPATFRDYLQETANDKKPQSILYHGVGRDLAGAKALKRGGQNTVDVYDKFHDRAAVRQLPSKLYDQIHSNYTLNVVNPEEGKGIMQEIHDRLHDTGKAIIHVRRDVAKSAKPRAPRSLKSLLPNKLNKAETKVSIPKKELIAEHKHLVNVLESPSRKDDKAEAKNQRKELKGYLKKGKDPLAEEVTSQKGVSESGIEARRADPKQKGVISHGYGRVTTPEKHGERAKSYFKQTLARLQAQPKPNLPKSEYEDIDNDGKNDAQEKHGQINPKKADLNQDGKVTHKEAVKASIKKSESPKVGIRGWKVKHQPSSNDGMVHFNHEYHGTITIKKNPRPATSGEHPYVAVHNGAPVGKYRDMQSAVMGVSNYTRTLGTQPHTRQYNVGFSKKEFPESNLKKSLGQGYFGKKLKKISNYAKAHREEIGAHDDACVLDFKPAANMALEKEIQRKLSPLNKGSKEDYSQNPADKQLVEKLAQPAAPESTTIGKLLTPEKSNPKTAKNANVGGVLSSLLMLSPATLSGKANVCPGLSAGCKASCLNTSGMGGMVSEKNPVNDAQAARLKRTNYLFNDPHGFLELLDHEIGRLKKDAYKAGVRPVIRLNGTSDLAWENMRHPDWQGKNLFEKHPEVQFYDYTARPERMRNNKYGNYHLTFSLKEDNHDIAKKLLQEGHNVAVPFGFKKATATKEEKAKGDYGITRPLPKTHWGYPVIDGETHDLRFLDPKGSPENGGIIVGLRAKGDAMHDTSGFVQWGHEGAPTARPKPKKAKSKEEIIRAGFKSGQMPKSRVKKKTKEQVNKAETSYFRSLLKSAKKPNLME